MRRYVLAVASIFLIAADRVLPTPEEQSRLSEPYANCLYQQAKSLDDGSKNMAMADAIVAACKPQFENMVTELIAESRNLSEEDERKLRESLSEMQRGLAAGQIGRVRLERRGMSVPKP
jgi:hypothetical protein